MSSKQYKIEHSTAKDYRQQQAEDKPSNGKRKKKIAKEWVVFEKGSPEYILQCHKAQAFMSWIDGWMKRGEYETEEIAEAAVRHFKTQTGDKYIHKIVRKDGKSR